MTDQTLILLRSANASNAKFFSAINQIRKKSAISNYRHLFSKIKRVKPFGRNTLIPTKTESLSKISGVIPLKSLPFEKEVAWTAFQIFDNLKKLIFHIECTGKLAKFINNGEFDSAIEIIEQHIRQYGETLWGIEAKIGILSRKDFSSEEVNKYLDSRFEVYGSIADYLAYLFLDLYDEDTTLGGFQRRMTLRLKTFTRSDLKNFINVKAMSFEETTSEALSDFVRVNSNFSLVDAYEALLTSVPQHLFSALDFQKNGVLLTVLAPLSKLGDPRLVQICNTLSYSAHFEKSISIDLLHKISPVDDFPDFRKISITSLCSKEQAASVGVTSENFSNIERQFSDLLLSFKDRNIELISTYEQLQTFASKYYFLPWFLSAKSWIEGIFLPFSGELRFLLYRASTCFQDISYVNLESLTQSLPWSTIYESSPEERNIYLQNSFSLLSENKNHCVEIPLSNNESLKYGNQLLGLAVALNFRDENKTLKICVNIAITNIGSSTFLPFAYIFEGKETWADLINLDTLDVIIGLYFTSLGDRESRNRFLLEFACKKMLSDFRDGSPSKILDIIDKSDPRVLFILREIFVPKNLRLVGGLHTVEDLEKFRIDVCAAMLDIDKEYSDRYVAETMEILQSQDLRKAEKEVESARINVDREGIKQWAEKTYREEFLRAKKARTTKMAPSIEEIEKNFSENVYSSENKENASLAQNLKDPIFSIASEIFSKCFWKEDDGLDHFLSLRIRHGSFAGYLRAPLEQVNLVGAGSPTAGLTKRFWSANLSRSSERSLELLLTALDSFQISFDTIVEHFRSDLLQISTVTKPHGLFIPGLHKALWDAYHLDWEGAKNFDVFFDYIWNAFQEALNSSLKIVISSIDEKILSGSENLLSNLRRTVNECGLDDIDRASVISALNEGVRSLQEAVKSVKKWFEVKRDPASDITLNSKQVLELALKLFKKIRPNFALEFQPTIESGNVVFSGTNISRVTDALFIIFDNIYKHSGLHDVAKIHLTFKWEEDSDKTGFFYISIISPISKDKNIDDIERRIHDVKNIMNSGNNRIALVNEGLSGLIKLSWLASKGQHGGKIDFSVSENKEFSVSIWMGFSFQSLS